MFRILKELMTISLPVINTGLDCIELQHQDRSQNPIAGHGSLAEFSI